MIIFLCNWNSKFKENASYFFPCSIEQGDDRQETGDAQPHPPWHEIRWDEHRHDRTHTEHHARQKSVQDVVGVDPREDERQVKVVWTGKYRLLLP